MSLTKVEYTDGQTVIYAQNLNDIQDEILRIDSDVDTTPTSGSDHLITSGGVYTALANDMNTVKASFWALLSADASTIANSTNYNTLTTAGAYRCTSSANATTMTNCPVTVAHRLIVTQLYASNRLTQFIISNVTGGDIGSQLWWRCKLSGENNDTNGWTTWRQVANRTLVEHMSSGNSSLTNVENDLIDYGYGVGFLAEDPTATNYSVTGMEQVGQMCIFNKTKKVSGAISNPTTYIKISNGISRFSSSSGPDGVSSGMTLKDGHLYCVRSTYVGGTAYYDESDPTGSSRVPTCHVYPTGTHASPASSHRIDRDHAMAIFTADGSKQYNIWWYLASNHWYFEDAKFIVTLEDLTESRAYNFRGDNTPSMTARSNIGGEMLFSANGLLFQSTTAIASGTKIEPGTNCRQVNLVDILNGIIEELKR